MTTSGSAAWWNHNTDARQMHIHVCLIIHIFILHTLEDLQFELCSLALQQCVNMNMRMYIYMYEYIHCA